jgi:hypothetical protein
MNKGGINAKRAKFSPLSGACDRRRGLILRGAVPASHLSHVPSRRQPCLPFFASLAFFFRIYTRERYESCFLEG